VLPEMPCRLSSDVVLHISLFFFVVAYMGSVCLDTACISLRLVGRSAACMCESSLDKLAVNGVLRIERDTHQ
jgi:hypothetical protein